MEAEVILCVLQINQDEHPGFDNRVMGTKSEVHRTRWTNQSVPRTTDEVLAVMQAQTCKENSP